MTNTTRYINKLSEIFNSYSVDIILFIFLTISTLKLTYFIDRTDIALYDETMYLESGLKIFEQPISYVRAPLYTLWYYLIYLVQHDRIALFFLTYKILVSLTTLVLYLYLRRLQVSPLVAIIASFLYLASPIPLIEPRPTHCALLTLLLFQFIATFSKRREDYYLIVGLGILIASYARSEYFVSFIVFCALSVFLIVWNWRRNPIRLSSFIPKTFLFLTVSSILLLLIGNPWEGSSSFFAFGQHFSLNWVTWNHSDIDPWTNWVSITESVFGNITSPYEALLSNPKAFFRHIFTNLLGYVQISIGLLTVKLPNFSSASIWLLGSKLLKVFEILLFVVAIIYLIRKRKVILRELDKKTFSHLVILFTCISIAVLPSVILIYPRSHYIMIQSVIAIEIGAYVISNSIPKNHVKKTGLLKALTIGFLVFILTPTYPLPFELKSLVTPNIHVIRFIDKLNIKTEVNLFESEGGYHVYLGKNYHWVLGNEQNIIGIYEPCLANNNTKANECDKKESYKQFALKKKINMIVLSKNFVKDNPYKDDNEFKTLLSKPESLGFSKFDIPGSGIALLVKNELLAGRHKNI